MAKFDKIAVLNKIGSTGMVPVFYHKDAEVAKKVVKACYDGGVRAFEFTNRGDFAHEVFAEVVKFPLKITFLFLSGFPLLHVVPFHVVEVAHACGVIFIVKI